MSTLNAQLAFAARALLDAAYALPVQRRTALALARAVVGAAGDIEAGMTEHQVVTPEYVDKCKAIAITLDIVKNSRNTEGDAMRDLETLKIMRRTYHALSDDLTFVTVAAPLHRLTTITLVSLYLVGLCELESDAAKLWADAFDAPRTHDIQMCLKELGWIR